MDPEAGGDSYQRGAVPGGVGNGQAQSSNGAGSSSSSSVERGQLPGGAKIKELQNDVNQLTSVMQTNITKVLERGDRMDTLNERSELLTSRANEFRINSRSIRRKFWWQNMRMQLIIGAVLLTLVIIIIYSIAK